MRVHRVAGAVVLLAACAFAAVFPAAAVGAVGRVGQEEEPSGPAVHGTLKDVGGEPVEGVVIVVEWDGEEVGRAESDADGEWFVPVRPGNSTFSVTLDVETLPEGVGLRDPDRATLDSVRVRLQPKRVLFPLGQPPETGPARWEQFVNLVVDGIRIGLILAVASVGLSLVFGITGLTNFAHGELVTFGALVAYLFSSAALFGDTPVLSWIFGGMPLVVAGAAAVVAGGCLGYAHERLLFRPLRRRKTGNVALIVVTIGLGLFLRNLYLIIFGGSPRVYARYAIQKGLDLGPVTLRPKDLVIMAIAASTLVLVAILLQRTRLGTAMRAVSDTHDLAAASGIDVSRVILAVWVGCGALAALGGVLWGTSDIIETDMGFSLLLLMFAAVVLGGIGTAYGPMVGGVLIGIAAQVSTYWISPKYRIGVALAVLIGAVLIRPQGILGRRERVG